MPGRVRREDDKAAVSGLILAGSGTTALSDMHLLGSILSLLSAVLTRGGMCVPTVQQLELYPKTFGPSGCASFET